MFKPCPFCHGSKIKYSIKSKGNYYQAACYCDTCHTYGPRVLSQPLDTRTARYSARYEVAADAALKLKAISLWNNRS